MGGLEFSVYVFRFVFLVTMSVFFADDVALARGFAWLKQMIFHSKWTAPDKSLPVVEFINCRFQYLGFQFVCKGGKKETSRYLRCHCHTPPADSDKKRSHRKTVDLSFSFPLLCDCLPVFS